MWWWKSSVGHVHKVRNDGTKITCSDGKFTAVKGRKGKAAEDEEDVDPQLNCEWYGQTFCVGDVIIDLYRWWFKVRCIDGEMQVIATQWQDVVNDPRFKDEQIQLDNNAIWGSLG